jgi:CRP/FNR family cyclic AMP-dependent transcriptional regulator
MTSDNVLETLKTQAFAAELEPAHVARLASMGQLVRFDPDRVIFKEGEQTDKFYLIVSGTVALEMVLPEMHQARNVLRLQRLGPGDGLGWSAALVGRGKHFQARALSDVEALVFEGAKVLEACRQDAGFGFAFMVRLLDVVSKRLQATRVQLVDMHSPVARQAGI